MTETLTTNSCPVSGAFRGTFSGSALNSQQTDGTTGSALGRLAGSGSTGSVVYGSFYNFFFISLSFTAIFLYRRLWKKWRW